MGVVFELEIEGRIVSLEHPEYGRFDAAGDFDRLLPLPGQLASRHAIPLPLLERVDAHGTSEFDAQEMSAMRAELVALQRVAHAGPERRGVERLAALAEHGSQTPGATLRAVGD